MNHFSAERSAPRLRNGYLDAGFLLHAFSQGCLAACPFAANAIDPLVYRGQDVAPEVAFIFSDIPDVQFREPSAVIMKSDFSGGIKS